MTTRMLIDARHREETRVAVVAGNRIEEFDFESAERKQLKGNIYLAKVTRVEPSLQAAFVDYGGNRHGFLAFSEIHPDYYQIPREDREALLREEAEHAAEEAALRAEQDDADDEARNGDDRHADGDDADDYDADRDVDADDDLDDDEPAVEGDAPVAKPRGNGTDDQVEALRQRRMNLRRRYKIQDVIRRRQVLLVQVVKEERGNKGAALTTYLSLAGRYCVLMPNTSNGGGISRKISSPSDRKRLKSIMADLALPSSMGCIVRTAGLQRTRTEIKRDFDYLARLWDEIRDKTLESSAPALVYGDSDLIKRAIRDIYNKDVDEVIVEGDEGYAQARDFMRLLMPGHARKVKHYSDPIPLYQRSHVEDQLAAMYNPVVQLKSGGYLVINPTEALVSIDINSGRSTREHNIEQTATATNLEAAAEIARQLRLRDMAGLVVIDFIDMDNSSNVRKVEKAMKEALKNDRARIQVGRISSFGLMEMSRQRLRTGVLEASTRGCPHCEGTGLVRTASSAGLSALRLIEEEAARGRGSCLSLRASQEAAIYVLNRKRADIAEIEERYGVLVEVLPTREEEGAHMSVEASGPPPAYAPRFDRPIVEEPEDDIPEEIEIEEDEEIEEAPRPERAARPERESSAERGDRTDGERGGRRRRRRGRRNRRPGEEAGDEQAGGEQLDAAGDDDDAPEREGAGPDAGDDRGDDVQPAFAGEQPLDEGDEGRKRRGRRGRGRRRGSREDGAAGAESLHAGEPADEAGSTVDPRLAADTPVDAQASTGKAGAADPEPARADAAPADAAAEPATGEPGPAAPRGRRRPRARAASETATVVTQPPIEKAPAGTAPSEPAMADAAPAEPLPAEPVAEEAPARPRRRRKADAPAETPPAEKAAPEPVADETPAPRRRRSRKADVPVMDADESAPAAPALTETSQTDGAAPAEDDAVTPAAPQAAQADDGVSSPGSASATDEAADGEAPRRGWWQRTFGT